MSPRAFRADIAHEDRVRVVEALRHVSDTAAEALAREFAPEEAEECDLEPYDPTCYRQAYEGWAEDKIEYAPDEFAEAFDELLDFLADVD